MDDLIGRIFDRKYQVTRLIGEGGMATVFEAEHTVLKRKVAVKVMHPEVASQPGASTRFFREAQSASAIGHPNIIEIFHVGQEDDGTTYIVEELLEGESLKQMMQREGKLSHRDAVAIALQVLSALAAAHEKGIIHRDIKPDNIFLSFDSRKRKEVKLLDFGVAKIQDGSLGVDKGLTQTGTVLGTPTYMSPEQARGKEIDGRSDLWAVGVILYEMLSGRLPFGGDSYNEVLSDILLETPPPLQQLAPELPRRLIAVVEKSMEKDRERRYARAIDMISDLQPFARQAAKRMSTPSAQALKDSISPAPQPGLKKTREKKPGTKRRLAQDRPGSSRNPHWETALRVVVLLGLIGVLVRYFPKSDTAVGRTVEGLLEEAVIFWDKVLIELPAGERVSPDAPQAASPRLVAPQPPIDAGAAPDAAAPDAAAPDAAAPDAPVSAAPRVLPPKAVSDPDPVPQLPMKKKAAGARSKTRKKRHR